MMLHSLAVWFLLYVRSQIVLGISKSILDAVIRTTVSRDELIRLQCDGFNFKGQVTETFAGGSPQIDGSPTTISCLPRCIECNAVLIIVKPSVRPSVPQTRAL